MTSNLGTEYVHKSGSLGFLQRSANQDERDSHDKIEKALKGTFRPEFLNRIDEIITFSPLTVEDMIKIVDLQMKEIEERLSEHGLKVALTDAARQWLANEGYDPAFGARPLRRALQKHVESPLSVSLLSGQFVEGSRILVDIDPEKNEPVFRLAEEQVSASVS
jgi:ATP-dependent Clp protease ATP-binding subunit ClpC